MARAAEAPVLHRRLRGPCRCGRLTSNVRHRMNTASVAQGSCLCGALRFKAELPTKWVAHCHCTYCRRAHGAPLVTWAGFPSHAFVLESGSIDPAWYESSPGARRAHCPRCGTPLFFESARWPGEIHIARALFEGALDKEPSAHVFYEAHVPWLEVLDNLPKKVSQSSAANTTTSLSATRDA
jgi:hypothetical protein